MKVIEYDPRYKQSFIDFNTAWITDNFGHLEPEDYETFEKIDRIFIKLLGDKGEHIYET